MKHCSVAGLVLAAGCAASVCGISHHAFAQTVPGVKPASPVTPATPPPATPASTDTGAAPPATLATDDPDMVSLSAFAEPLQLTTLVELVVQTLNINVSIEGDIPGSVVFNAPVPVKKSDLIPLLDSLLEQHQFTITQNRFGFYRIHPVADVRVNLAGERSTTRVFSTPNIRPSALKQPIEGQLAISQQAAPGGGMRQIAYVDDLGVIIATDTPARLDAIASLVEKVLEEYSKATFIRIELHHISAPVARERMFQLVGLATQRSGTGDVQQNFNNTNNAQAATVTGGKLDNMAERLTVDPQGNALIFRGLPEEVRQIMQVKEVIDVPNTLVPKKHFVGSAARQVADIARQRGLGEIITISSGGMDPNTGIDFEQQRRQQQALQGGNQQSSGGGPVMVVDETKGEIVYYGTQAQQDQLGALIVEIDPQSELTVTRVYRLRNGKAVDIANIINGLINNTQPAGSSDLLPDEGGFTPSFGGSFSNRRLRPQPRNPAQSTGTDDGLSLESAHAFVIGDEKNNQLLVKAPAGQQSEFAKLIDKLDLRRPQVYIEAKIVAVTADDRLRLAFETQLINANGTGGVLNTNFGLGSFAAGSAITASKTVATGLSGFTAAIIKSDSVPVIMTALANETNSRVISSPQLLVDDNEEAEVVSLDEQPYTTTTLAGAGGTTGNNTNVTFGGFAEAGTKLLVMPQISEGGYLRMKYDIELSSFTGDSSGPGVPPPRQKNNIRSDSVTVPSDCTVVVGGLVLNSKNKTVAKVPLLGDIPLLGLLFQDQRTGDRQTTLYVFLTPKILREPTFADLRLLTRGPRDASRIDPDVPSLSPSLIEVFTPDAPPALPPTNTPEPQPAPIPAAAPAAAPTPARDDAPVTDPAKSDGPSPD